MSELSTLLQVRNEIEAELAKPKWQRDESLREKLAAIDARIDALESGHAKEELTLF